MMRISIVATEKGERMMARYIDVDKISSYIRENFSIDKTKKCRYLFCFYIFDELAL